MRRPIPSPGQKATHIANVGKLIENVYGVAVAVDEQMMVTTHEVATG